MPESVCRLQIVNHTQKVATPRDGAWFPVMMVQSGLSPRRKVIVFYLRLLKTEGSKLLSKNGGNSTWTEFP